MPQFVPCNFSDNKIELLTESVKQDTSFKQLGISEAQIEAFLKDNIELIAEGGGNDKRENLLIVGQQVIDSSNGRCDLVALDGEGNLVLIEVKRDKEDMHSRAEPLEIQAIRYAAAMARINTPEMLIESMFSSYLERQGVTDPTLTATEKARRELGKFLDNNFAGSNFNRRQRIVLVASSFDERTLSACSWLIQNGVDITVIGIKPMRLPGGLDVLNIERLLPPRELGDYLLDIKVPGKSSAASSISNANKSTRRDLPRMAKLFEWQIIQPDDEIYLKKWPESTAKVIDSDRVLYKGEPRRFNDWAKEVTGWSAICIYDWLVVVRHQKTLSELRDERMKQEEDFQLPT